MTQILMPALSPTMEEGKLAAWHVKEGDRVRSGDVVAEIETDKATMEVEAPEDGMIEKLLLAAGTEPVEQADRPRACQQTETRRTRQVDKGGRGNRDLLPAVVPLDVTVTSQLQGREPPPLREAIHSVPLARPAPRVAELDSGTARSRELREPGEHIIVGILGQRALDDVLPP